MARQVSVDTQGIEEILNIDAGRFQQLSAKYY